MFNRLFSAIPIPALKR